MAVDAELRSNPKERTAVIEYNPTPKKAQQKINDPARSARKLARELAGYRDTFLKYHPQWRLQADDFDRMRACASDLAEALEKGGAL